MLSCLRMTNNTKKQLHPDYNCHQLTETFKADNNQSPQQAFFFSLSVGDLKKAQITATKSNLGPLAHLVLRLRLAGTYLWSSSEGDSSAAPPTTHTPLCGGHSACHRLSRHSLSIPPVRIWIPIRLFAAFAAVWQLPVIWHEIHPPQLQTAGMKAELTEDSKNWMSQRIVMATGLFRPSSQEYILNMNTKKKKQ